MINEYSQSDNSTFPTDSDGVIRYTQGGSLRQSSNVNTTQPSMKYDL